MNFPGGVAGLPAGAGHRLQTLLLGLIAVTPRLVLLSCRQDHRSFSFAAEEMRSTRDSRSTGLAKQA